MLDLARKLIPPSLQPTPKRPRVVKSAGEGRTKKFFHLRETTAARDTLISPQRRRRHRKNGFSPPSPPSVPPSFPLWDEDDDDVTNLLKLLALHTRSLSFPPNVTPAIVQAFSESRSVQSLFPSLFRSSAATSLPQSSPPPRRPLARPFLPSASPNPSPFSHRRLRRRDPDVRRRRRLPASHGQLCPFFCRAAEYL